METAAGYSRETTTSPEPVARGGCTRSSVKYLSNRAFHSREYIAGREDVPGASLIFIREISRGDWRAGCEGSPIAVLLAPLETGLSTFLCPAEIRRREGTRAPFENFQPLLFPASLSPLTPPLRSLSPDSSNFPRPRDSLGISYRAEHLSFFRTCVAVDESVRLVCFC